MKFLSILLLFVLVSCGQNSGNKKTSGDSSNPRINPQCGRDKSTLCMIHADYQLLLAKKLPTNYRLNFNFNAFASDREYTIVDTCRRTYEPRRVTYNEPAMIIDWVDLQVQNNKEVEIVIIDLGEKCTEEKIVFVGYQWATVEVREGKRDLLTYSIKN